MPSSTVEDYIKHIYLLSDRAVSSEVPMGRVAEALGVVPGTATTMMNRMMAMARLPSWSMWLAQKMASDDMMGGA